MKYGSLVFSKENFVMIKYYQEMNEMYEDYAHKDTLDILSENMSKALVIDMDDVPADVAQLYSSITVNCNSTWNETFQLVPPYEENIKKDKISVISTLGASLIGLSECDTLKYGLPGNIIALTIDKVVQRKEQVKLNIPEEAYERILSDRESNLLT